MELKYKDLSLGGGSSSENIYSTEETVIGTWIDGKPIYRRVIESTDSVLLSLFTRNDATLLNTIKPEIENIEFYTNVYGYVVGSDGVTYLPGVGYKGAYASSFGIVANMANGIILVRSGVNGGVSGASKVVLTYEYTKTTD